MNALKPEHDPIWEDNEGDDTVQHISGWKVVLLIAGFIALGLWLRLGMGPDQAADTAKSDCRRNLQVISEHIHQYAEAHAGDLPDQLDDVTGLTPTELWCPRGLTRITMEANRGSSQAMNVPHSDYTYWGKGLTVADPPNTILLTESLGNHGDGMNVLYVDGVVEFVPEAAGRRVLESLKSGQNPPVQSLRTK